MYNIETRCLARLFSIKETMNNLLANTLQQEIDALQAQLTTIEERAAALRATIAQYKKVVAAEQQTATEALTAAKNAQETAVSALAAAKAAQEQLTNISVAKTPAVETPYIASPEEETEEEVEIELVYEEDESADTVETPYMASLEKEEEELEVEPTVETSSIASPETDNAIVSSSAGGVGGGFPVEDIRKAISLGDRFLFQRELFAGNGELMNKTIDKLNTLSSLDEALAYINKNFSWDSESQAYELFINILKRRWL